MFRCLLKWSLGCSLAVALMAIGGIFAGAAHAEETTLTLDGIGVCSHDDLSFGGQFDPGTPVIVRAVSIQIDAWDVDPETATGGELDQVYVNGILLGKLVGANNSDSTTTFNLSAAQIATIFGPLTTTPTDIDIYVDVDVKNNGACVQVKETRINITFDVVKALCRNGGWADLVDDHGNAFKNQGDCVSFAATRGKNTGAITP